MIERRKLIESFEDIDELYSGVEIPVLDDELLCEIKDYLDRHGCVNLGGSVLLGTDNTSANANLHRRNLIARRNDTFKGPNILGGKYFANGIGIWTSGDLGPIR